MSVKFILGRAGSGKTEKCLSEIRQELLAHPSGDPLILLVPEQATFQAEHALVTTPGLKGLIRAQVLSFRRLAWRVMQETGNTAGNPIDDVGKKMLLIWILQHKAGELKQFHALSEKMGFIDNLNTLITELGRYCLTPDMLQDQMERIADEDADEAQLRAKLHDLQLVFREFEALMSAKYLDAEAYLKHLANQLQHSSLAGKARIWIDGFHGFTPQELEVVAQAMAHCKDVTISLCLNRPYEAYEIPDETDLFYPTAATLIRLQKKIEELGLPPATFEVLTDQPRFVGRPMLAHLERHYEDRLIGRKVAYDQPGEEIVLYAAANRRAEVEGAAREILSLVRDHGMRFKDIAVRVRNIESYGDLIRTTFEDYDIPYFLDQKRTVLHHPLVEFIRSALEVVLGGWRFDAVFRCVKTDLLLPLVDGKLPRKNSRRIARNEMDELENLVLAFGIQGSRWTDTKNWTFTRYRSLDDEIPVEVDATYAKRMDHLRRTVARPLRKLQKRLKAADNVREQVEAVYCLLEDVGVAEQIQRWSEEALFAGKPEKSKEHAQIYENIIDMFDQMVEILGEEKASLELFRKLIDTGLEGIQQGLVPPSLDQVLIGSIDRTRSAQVAVTLVLGVNDGVLPQAFTESGIITETEREKLLERGLRMADSARRRLLDEQFLIYTVLCSPSKKLWLSFPLADEEGGALLPSEVIKHLKIMFPYALKGHLHGKPDSTMDDRDQIAYISAPNHTLSYLIVQLKEWLKGEPVSDIWFDVYNWYLSQPQWKDRLAILSGALSFTNQESQLSASTSKLLYGDELITSVTRMEQFVACPFSHFAMSGLQLKERKIFRMAAPDVGGLYHASLRALFEKLREEGIPLESVSPEALMEKTTAVVNEIIPRLPGGILASSHRYRHIARKLTRVVQSSVVALQAHARRGAFVPVGFEVSFGHGGQLPPLEIQLAQGRRMQIAGRIDRIDVARQGEKAFLRVVDYKSSAKSLNLEEVYHGLSLQTLTYLDVAVRNSENWLGQKASPAGALYFHVHNPIVNGNNPAANEAVEKEKRKSFKMEGLVLADPDVVKLMDSEIGSGTSDIIPVGIKKDGGFYSNSSIATVEQFESLQKHVHETLAKVGRRIYDGSVEIAPIRTNKKTACTFCPMKPVCQFDPLFHGNKHHLLKGMSKDEVWQVLHEKEAGAAMSQ
jgi:ATP-dependent helicase/nuclease subunit B